MASKPEDMSEHCTQRGAELELGQIGLCDNCQPQLKKWFCLSAGGTMNFVGEFDCFEAAEEAWLAKQGESSIWLFDAETAREFVADINANL